MVARVNDLLKNNDSPIADSAEQAARPDKVADYLATMGLLSACFAISRDCYFWLVDPT